MSARDSHDHKAGPENCAACRWNGMSWRERERLADARYEWEQQQLAEETR